MNKKEAMDDLKELLISTIKVAASPKVNLTDEQCESIIENIGMDISLKKINSQDGSKTN